MTGTAANPFLPQGNLLKKDRYNARYHGETNHL